jgi:predicted aldo/keto reductase-like oxidoreductase
LNNPKVFDVFNKLKKQGKVRYLGFSEHSGDNLAEAIRYAYPKGYSLVMPASWTLQKNYEDVASAMNKAFGNSKMGFVCMKVLKVRTSGVKEVIKAGKTPAQLDQACIKWINSRGKVVSAILTCNTKSKIDKFLPASGLKLGAMDRKIIHIYDRALANVKLCNFTCSSPCEKECGYNIPIQNIMRFDMYDRDYKSRRFASLHYNQLPGNEKAKPCNSCNAPCSSKCPEDLNIRKILSRVHRRLG